MLDYYQILGVIPDAEPAVIKGAYRALINIYHPDRNSDPSAKTKAKEINEAYSVLSDPAKKKEYDTKRKGSDRDANSDAFDSKKPFSTDPFEDSWSLAVGFFPRLQTEHDRLESISWRLAFAFKAQVSESRDYKNAYTIANKLRLEYLYRYFGKNTDIIELAELLIMAKEIDAALYLNKIVKVMGSSVNQIQVRNRIDDQFPGVISRAKSSFLYQRLKNSYGSFEFDEIDELVRSNGGNTKFKFWGTGIVLEIDDTTKSFSSYRELLPFLIDYLHDKYV